MRESKLQAMADTGCTTLEALERKYNPWSGADRSGLHSEADMRLDDKVTVQLVGMAKLQHQRGGIERLEEVSLIDASISSIVSY